MNTRATSIMAGALSCMLAASTADAQIQPGRTYGAGDVISDPESGLRLTMPPEWRGQLAPDGESFVMRSTTGGAFMMVVADAMTATEVRRRMAERLDLGDGVVLTPADTAREIVSDHYSARYRVAGTPGEMLGLVDVKLTATGLGVAFILLAPPAELETHEQAMRQFAFSLGVAEPSRQVAAAQAGGTSGDAWEPYLRGRYLARYFTRTGYTESTELWLCSDGSFRYTSQGGGFGGGASGAALRTGVGRWSATGAGERGALVLAWSDGGRTTLALRYDYQSDRLYVENERFLRGQNEYCR